MEFLPGVGYFVGALSDNGALTIGGRCPLNGAVSPNNGLPLTQFARVRLDPKEFYIPGWASPDIHFLYSWKCKIHEGDFSYKYKNNEISIVEYRQGKEEDFDDFPFENYPVIFDDFTFGLHRIPDEDQAIILELNKDDCDSDFKLSHDRLSTPVHQFGGVPYFLQSLKEKGCPVCGNGMPVVASIGNLSYSTNEGFVGNDFVQVVYWACSKCSLISANNFCD